MSKYLGYFDILLNKKYLVPAILQALGGTYPLHQGVEGNSILVLSPNTESTTLKTLISALVVLEQGVIEELKRRRQKEEDIHAPYFHLRATISETIQGDWGNATDTKKPLEGFPRCRLSQISVNHVCFVQQSSRLLPVGREEDRVYRAIEVRQYFNGISQSGDNSMFTYKKSIIPFLADETLIDEVFRCFKKYNNLKET